MLTQAQIEQTFGKFGWREDSNRKGQVVIDGDWILHHLARITPPMPLIDGNGHALRVIACHALIADRLTAVLQDLKRDGLSHLINTFDGCWCPRHTLWNPAKSLSHHSWGIAVDVNARLFPFGSHQAQDQRLIAAFRKHGFEWAGLWHTPDPMHFEIAEIAPQIPDAEALKIIVNDQVVSTEGAIRGGQAIGPLAPIATALGATLTLHPEQGKVYIYRGDGP